MFVEKRLNDGRQRVEYAAHQLEIARRVAVLSSFHLGEEGFPGTSMQPRRAKLRQPIKQPVKLGVVEGESHPSESVIHSPVLPSVAAECPHYHPEYKTASAPWRCAQCAITIMTRGRAALSEVAAWWRDARTTAAAYLDLAATAVTVRVRKSRPCTCRQVEGHEHRRRGSRVGIGSAEQMKLTDEVFIEHADLAIEDQRGRFQRGDRVGELAEAVGVTTAWRLIRRTRAPSSKASMRQPPYFSS